jgi:hypothetical protein
MISKCFLCGGAGLGSYLCDVSGCKNFSKYVTCVECINKLDGGYLYCYCSEECLERDLQIVFERLRTSVIAIPEYLSILNSYNSTILYNLEVIYANM